MKGDIAIWGTWVLLLSVLICEVDCMKNNVEKRMAFFRTPSKADRSRNAVSSTPMKDRYFPTNVSAAIYKLINRFVSDKPKGNVEKTSIGKNTGLEIRVGKRIPWMKMLDK